MGRAELNGNQAILHGYPYLVSRRVVALKEPQRLHA